MSILSQSSKGIEHLPFYSVGDMTFIPGCGHMPRLQYNTIEIATELWPAHKVYYMLPELDSTPRTVLILSESLKDHSVDQRRMLIWDTQSNIVPALNLQEGIVISLTGVRYRALLAIGWREAVYGAIPYFVNRWASVGESEQINSCYLTPYVTAEQTPVAGNELDIVRSTQMGRFVRATDEEENGFGLDLSMAVKYQLESWLGPNQVVIVHSVADHFGHYPRVDGDATIKTPQPMPGVYLGLCS